MGPADLSDGPQAGMSAYIPMPKTVPSPLQSASVRRRPAVSFASPAICPSSPPHAAGDAAGPSRTRPDPWYGNRRARNARHRLGRLRLSRPSRRYPPVCAASASGGPGRHRMSGNRQAPRTQSISPVISSMWSRSTTTSPTTSPSTSMSAPSCRRRFSTSAMNSAAFSAYTPTVGSPANRRSS